MLLLSLCFYMHRKMYKIRSIASVLTRETQKSILFSCWIWEVVFQRHKWQVCLNPMEIHLSHIYAFKKSAALDYKRPVLNLKALIQISFLHSQQRYAVFKEMSTYYRVCSAHKNAFT